MVSLEMTPLQPPFKITALLRSSWVLETLRSGVYFDIFSKLAARPRNAAQLAEEIGTDSRATEMLLDALAAMEFLENNNGIYEVAPVARLYLVADSPLYMGKSVLDDRPYPGWSNLSQVIKTGRSACKVNVENKASEFFPELAERIFPQNYCAAHAVATRLQIELFAAGTKVLDIAAGSGAWSLPLAERNKNIHVDALDFHSVLDVTRRFVEKYKVAEQYSYIAGNWSKCSLEPESYDIILLGHIMHSEGIKRSCALLQESYRCLKKGGKLVLAEVFADRDRPASVFVQLFALNMLIQTEEGCVFTESQLAEMLAEAGFRDVIRPPLPYWEHESPVLIATK